MVSFYCVCKTIHIHIHLNSHIYLFVYTVFHHEPYLPVQIIVECGWCQQSKVINHFAPCVRYGDSWYDV